MTEMAWPELPAVKRKLIIKRKELKHIEPGAEVWIVWHDGPEHGTFLGLGAGETYRFANARGEQVYVNPRSSDLKYMLPIIDDRPLCWRTNDWHKGRSG